MIIEHYNLDQKHTHTITLINLLFLICCVAHISACGFILIGMN